MFLMPIQKGTSPLAMGTDGLVKKNEFQNEQEKEELLIKKLVIALQTGYRLFDTAQNYGTLLALIKAIGDYGIKREDVQIVYKINPAQDMSVFEGVLLEAVKIAGGYLDVVMLHETNDQSMVQSALVVLQKLVNSKLAGCIGLSNTNHFELPDYLNICPAIQYVQSAFTLINYLEQKETLELCKSKNITYMGFGLIRAMSDENLLTELAHKYGCKPAQVLLAWARAIGVLPIVVSSQAANIQENWGSITVSLGQEAVNAITDLAIKSFPSTPEVETIVQSSQTVLPGIPEILPPFYQAVKELEAMGSQKANLGAHTLIDDKKTAVILCWNTLEDQIKQGTDLALKNGLVKWRVNGKTLPKVMEEMKKDSGYCSAPNYAPAIIQIIDGFCMEAYSCLIHLG